MHEAGHLVMARHLGLQDCQAVIWPTKDPGHHDKTWIGRAKLSFSDMGRLSREGRAMLGVAGAVAEEVWLERARGEEPADWADFFFDPESLSTSDWSMAGCRPGDPQDLLPEPAEEAARLFAPEGGPLWIPLLRAARGIIRAARPVSGA